MAWFGYLQLLGYSYLRFLQGSLLLRNIRILSMTYMNSGLDYPNPYCRFVAFPRLSNDKAEWSFLG